MSTLLIVGIVLIVVGMSDMAIMPVMRRKNPVVGNIILATSILSIVAGIVLVIIDNL
jgi:uncharacterized membrane protein HdeD (DUF308 family)